MRDALEEIRRAGRLALRPVTSPELNPDPPATHLTESAPDALDDNSHTEHISNGSYSATDITS
jgi:hypothetical protein